ncbi:heparinase II/III family protein [Avibacterium avium]|uniref:heparinase II/III family protein n=1 Tax=Avibacterium avium TaxID=751 RepID=UPI003BF8D43D
MLVVKVKTALSLGLFNLFRVFKYRIGIKIGLNPVKKLSAEMPSGTFFYTKSQLNREILDFPKTLKAFGYYNYPLRSECPDWFYNPLTQTYSNKSNLPWYQIPDFDPNIGDIKGIWEASRFEWILDFVIDIKQKNDIAKLHILDIWLNDWCQKNLAYIGLNWKCGQEASIRVMHLLVALIGLNQLSNPSKNVLQLIELHLKRIAPTIDYAIAQDNNHGTSEATALFIGGALLNHMAPKRKYKIWEKLGRKWLENRAKKLIMEDGGFSQYSVNYHRVMLDSYSLAEIVRQKLNLKSFSNKLYDQIKNATDWLYVLAQEENGDAPNIGANDGARLLAVSKSDYRDFRPSIQLASTLFNQSSYYAKPGTYDESLEFFQLEKKIPNSSNPPKKNQFFSKSGLITAQKKDFFIAFKLPIFKFRPSQCDALHLDIWWRGENILRDGGTYSYNSTAEDLKYFSGVASHNTVQFDEHEQMPRLSRFLFGSWLKPSQVNYQLDKFTCAYQDYWRCKHHREVVFKDKSIQVIDTISGFKKQAILRWRLQPSQWNLKGNILSNDNISITIHSDSRLELQLAQGEESRYYYQKHSLPVLEIKVTQATSITTIIQKI